VLLAVSLMNTIFYFSIEMYSSFLVGPYGGRNASQPLFVDTNNSLFLYFINF